MGKAARNRAQNTTTTKTKPISFEEARKQGISAPAGPSIGASVPPHFHPENGDSADDVYLLSYEENGAEHRIIVMAVGDGIAITKGDQQVVIPMGFSGLIAGALSEISGIEPSADLTD